MKTIQFSETASPRTVYMFAWEARHDLITQGKLIICVPAGHVEGSKVLPVLW